MIKPLFSVVFSVKRFLPRIVLGFLLGLFSVAAYLETPLEAVRYAQSELPGLFSLIGFYGTSSLPSFALSLLYGFLLPLAVSLICASSANHFVALPLRDGRMAFYTASCHGRTPVILTCFFSAVMSVALFVLSVLSGQALAALFFFPQADLPALARLNLGFLMVSLLFSSLCVTLAVFSKTERGMKAATRSVLGLMLLFLVLSRLQNLAGNFRYLTFWTLFEGAPFLFGSGGFLGGLAAVLLSALMLFISILSFSKREL